MNRMGLYTIIALACLGISGVLTNVYLFKQPLRRQSDLTKNISPSLGSWRMLRQETPLPSEFNGLETRDIIKRTYSDGEHTIRLIVAYIARSSRKSAHAQEACLRGAGAYVGAIESIRPRGTPVQATSITIDYQNRSALVYYWYKIGNTYTSRYLQSSLRMFLGGLAGRKGKGAALVRISTFMEKGQKKAAERVGVPLQGH